MRRLARGPRGRIDRLHDARGLTVGDGPTSGLILCAEKNEAIARCSLLHDNHRLLAAKKAGLN